MATSRRVLDKRRTSAAMPWGFFFCMNDDRDYRLVRSVVYTCRLLGERPSAAKVIAAIKALSGRGLRKADVCAHMRRLFAEENTDGNRSGTVPELSGTVPEPILSTTGTPPEQTGTPPEHHAQIVNGNSKPKDTPPEVANATSAPPVATRVKPQIEPVEFGDEDERRVKQSLAFVAAENKGGLISATRVLSLRGEMHHELNACGEERWRYGMDEANARGKPWAYARNVMRRTAEVPKPEPAARGSPRSNGRDYAPPVVDAGWNDQLREFMKGNG